MGFNWYSSAYKDGVFNASDAFYFPYALPAGTIQLLAAVVGR
jgi:hypothetical protein